MDTGTTTTPQTDEPITSEAPTTPPSNSSSSRNRRPNAVAKGLIHAKGLQSSVRNITCSKPPTKPSVLGSRTTLAVSFMLGSQGELYDQSDRPQRTGDVLAQRRRYLESLATRGRCRSRSRGRLLLLRRTVRSCGPKFGLPGRPQEYSEQVTLIVSRISRPRSLSRAGPFCISLFQELPATGTNWLCRPERACYRGAIQSK